MSAAQPTASDVVSDRERPNVGRMYDFLLGGSHNFAADREAAQQAIRAVPRLPAIARANRSFLRRAVTFLAGQGIEQYLDLGSGIPTVGNVHQVAQHANPGARVVYVDNNPIAVAHSQHLLAGNPNATAIQADLRQPDLIITHPEVTGLFDVSQPVAVLMVAVLHFLPDLDPHAGQPLGDALGVYRDKLASGSYLAISHATLDDTPDTLKEIRQSTTSTPAPARP